MAADLNIGIQFPGMVTCCKIVLIQNQFAEGWVDGKILENQMFASTREQTSSCLPDNFQFLTTAIVT